MNTFTAEFRTVTPRPVWIAARARNAMRRPLFIGAVGGLTFAITLVTLLFVIPATTQRAARAVAPRPNEWPDTVALLRSAGTARGRVAAAESLLATARARRAALTTQSIDTLSPATLAARDSLANSVTELDRLVARVENAPLLASYRALAEAPQLAGNARVRALLDSLSDIEREREGFGTSGGADPVFVALTSRANEIGRTLEGIAQARRAQIQGEIAALTPVPRTPSVTELAAADTTIPRTLVDSAAVAAQRADAALAAARVRAAALTTRAEKAREIARFSAPPAALVGAAAVLGLVLGFGVVLLDELRHPRVADQHEAERVAGIRVLAVVRPRPPSPDRNRRHADRVAPPFLDPRNDGYQLVYLHIASNATTGNLLMLTVTGDDPAIAAVVATNFAAIATEEARSVLLADADTASGAVASLLNVRAQPGFADLLDGRANWPEVALQAPIGRDRTMDVVPGGLGLTEAEPADVMTLMRRDVSRLTRHYDTILLHATAKQTVGGLPSVLPKPDVLYCVRVGHTRLGELRRVLDEIIAAGGRVAGIVLWDADPPPLRTPQELAAWSPPGRTSEFEVATAGR